MLVIFDCDGVLVDSESLAAEVFSEQLSLLGIFFSPAECFTAFHGHSLAHCYSWVEQQFDKKLPANFSETLAKASAIRFAADLKPVEGVGKLLEQLQRSGIPYCVASNGAHKKINHSLEVTGLSDYFPCVPGFHRRFSIDDVQRGKPAPDIFLYASEVVGVPARFCTVVEDSESGFKAATAAGMKLIKYLPASGARNPLEPKNSASVSSMEELLTSWQDLMR
ncbi:haloacid dehalogenase superfamily, subfamily IA, variant 3 with third motif having DD or ED [Alteromonadaceae bacterium Bs31]|nr:haloacid dehalogenase superfamily, subfamily IA, variant 3 with third motif having DD or ED [Alteromonadaceae bacterium Bs31]